MKSYAEPFRAYLTQRLSGNSVNSYMSGLRHISKHYKSDIFTISDFNIAQNLKNSYGLKGKNRKIGDYGNGAARNAMNKYANFLEDASSPNNILPNSQVDTSEPIDVNQQFTYEKDLHRTLEEQISELFPGYTLVGSEYSIEGVRVDLLLEKPSELLVVELKAGVAKYEVFGQVSMYMGLIQQQYPDYNVYGLIIANEIHKGLTAACKTNPLISCQKYTMKLALENA